jgi:hypothetical protein
MNQFIVAAWVGLAAMLALARSSLGAQCANGVYRAGCAGPNGAAVVRKPPAKKPTVKCGQGVHRAGCVGPNGNAAVAPKTI